MRDSTRLLKPVPRSHHHGLLALSNNASTASGTNTTVSALTRVFQDTRLQHTHTQALKGPIRRDFQAWCIPMMQQCDWSTQPESSSGETMGSSSQAILRESMSASSIPSRIKSRYPMACSSSESSIREPAGSFQRSNGMAKLCTQLHNPFTTSPG